MAAIGKNREQISNINFSIDKSDRTEFENCEFSNCIFVDLKGVEFEDCVFKNCNLSNVNFKNCKLQDVEFYDCKLLGTNFSQAKDFGFCILFSDCILDYASFDRRRMNKSAFKNCRMRGANFTQADLSKCTLGNCDLSETLFDGTNLSGLDFTTSKNFFIDPEKNTIKKAKFLSQDLHGLLYRHDIVVV